MSVASGLRQLWRQRRFRRLLLVKLFSQTADGMVQVGVASYTLLSPERAPGAWALAGVLAVTMLPFSILGPFVSVVIDRWDRRRTIIVADTCRIVFTVGLAACVWFSRYDLAWLAPVLFLALVTMSLERFQIATLMAAVPHTIDEGEYLAANTALPLIGPVGVMVGAAVGAAIRLTVGSGINEPTADTLIFVLAALCFVASVLTCRGFARRSLGPSRPAIHKIGETLRDLGAAVDHVRRHRPAALGILTVAAVRFLFGFIMVATILMYRNYFHAAHEVDEAVADLAIWLIATGAGFVLASAVNPFVARQWSLRVTVVAVLVAAGVSQALPGSIFTRPTLVVASCLLGLWAQCVKMNADTLVQAHISDEFKGRVWVLYDMAFNLPFVLAGTVVALLLPDNGRSHVAFLACALGYLLLAAVFAWRSTAIGARAFDRGTESLSD
jgi:MFS family permease